MLTWPGAVGPLTGKFQMHIPAGESTGRELAAPKRSVADALMYLVRRVLGPFGPARRSVLCTEDRACVDEERNSQRASEAGTEERRPGSKRSPQLAGRSGACWTAGARKDWVRYWPFPSYRVRRTQKAPRAVVFVSWSGIANGVGEIGGWEADTQHRVFSRKSPLRRSAAFKSETIMHTVRCSSHCSSRAPRNCLLLVPWP